MAMQHLFSTLTALLILPVLVICPAYATPEADLNLSKSQLRWLQSHPTIRLASDIAWPPFEWVDKHQRFQGIAPDYMRLIEKKLGIKFIHAPTKTWPEVVAAVKDHRLDVFSCVAKNEQRQKYVNFTRPYLSFPMVMVTTSEVNYIDGIEGLNEYTVGVVDGYATHEYFKNNYPKIKLYIVKTSVEGLQAVSLGKITVFIDNIATVSNLIQKKGLTNLKISGEMPVRYELSMAVRKDWPELIEILQKALDSISHEQRKQIHNKWIGVRFEHGVDYNFFWKSAAIFLVIIAFLYFYNRKLAHEIRQRKLAELAAVNARDEADIANRAKSQFLSIVSHELRTPLTSIKGSLGLLVGGVTTELPESSEKMLRIAYENSDRLSILIDDILDIEKMLAGKLVLHKTSLDIPALVHKAATANQSYADQYDVKLSVVLNQQKPCTVTADENRLLQVLSNFISNAIKYSPKRANVCITVDCDAGNVRVSVTDQGKGVPREFQQHIFSPFSQADSSDTRKKGGTGLGLAISKKIIELHGGNIGFESIPDSGATFYFELTIDKPD